MVVKLVDGLPRPVPGRAANGKTSNMNQPQLVACVSASAGPFRTLHALASNVRIGYCLLRKGNKASDQRSVCGLERAIVVFLL